MVRISDARMSGTGFGTCVLHVAPEAAAGGPLGLVQTGDLIELNVDQRRLDLLVDEQTLAAAAVRTGGAAAPSRTWLGRRLLPARDAGRPRSRSRFPGRRQHRRCA